MILYLMLILNMPFIFCHGDGNLLKKVNQVKKKSKNYFPSTCFLSEVLWQEKIRTQRLCAQNLMKSGIEENELLPACFGESLVPWIADISISQRDGPLAMLYGLNKVLSIFHLLLMSKRTFALRHLLLYCPQTGQ